ncbi:MAG: hypothetical protein WA775_10920 [Psychroserpens sp.]|uniref:hypothetical protein n=1 Tax=Psychroserpens sp. TaxID=2020870 RepID=UPI003C7111CC
MEKENEKKPVDVQGLLSLGYIYLLILGIIHNAVYYNLLDIQYLEHSSILDVLISPINVITSSLKSALIFLAIVVLSLLYVRGLIPLVVRWRRKQKKYQSGKKLDQINGLDHLAKNRYASLVIMAIFIFGYFVGFGYGRGIKYNLAIAENTIENDYRIDFINSKSIDVKILGKNSLNVFYISQGEKQISISPIDGNVMTIRKLSK